MKKIISSLIVLTILAAAIPALALDSYSPVGQPNGKFQIPESTNGHEDLDRLWSLPSICRVEKSLTCVQCVAAGAGFVTDLEADSGVTGGFAAVFDSISLVGEVATVPLAGTLLAEQQTFGVAANTNGGSGRKQFSDGRPFTGGLVLCTSASDIYAIATYRVIRK